MIFSGVAILNCRYISREAFESLSSICSAFNAVPMAKSFLKTIFSEGNRCCAILPVQLINNKKA
jgi:ABC-type uncharacterized transport system permease subunit